MTPSPKAVAGRPDDKKKEGVLGKDYWLGPLPGESLESAMRNSGLFPEMTTSKATAPDEALAASKLMLEVQVRPMTYVGPCDFDGDAHKESEATVEFLIPNGFGDTFHLAVCNSCYKKISEATARQKDELVAKVERLITDTGLKVENEVKEIEEDEGWSGQNIEYIAKMRGRIEGFKIVLTTLTAKEGERQPKEEERA